MAETNTAALTDNEESSQGPEVSAENQIPPTPLDIGGKFGADMPPRENPMPDIADMLLAPDVKDGDVIVASNIIPHRVIVFNKRICKYLY